MQLNYYIFRTVNKTIYKIISPSLHGLYMLVCGDKLSLTNFSVKLIVKIYYGVK